jgi:interferon-induced GTP-binding protein Mx1
VARILDNVTKPLKLGYVALKNRTNQQLKDGITLMEARAAEKSFFLGHDIFRHLPPATLGVEALTAKLTSTLVYRIKVSLPEMSAQVDRLLKQAKLDHDKLGKPAPSGVSECARVAMQMVEELRIRYSACAAGNYDTTFAKDVRLRLYARSYTLWESLATNVTDTWPTAIFPGSGENITDAIATELRAMRVRGMGDIFNAQAFKSFVGRYVDACEPLAMDCLENVYAATVEVIGLLIDDVFQQYPALRTKVKEETNRILEECFEQASTQIAEVLKLEREPFTLNHYLFDTINKERMKGFERVLEKALNDNKAVVVGSDGKYVSDVVHRDGVKNSLLAWFREERGVGTSNVKQEAQEMSNVLYSYWKTAVKRFVDSICQHIDASILLMSKEKVAGCGFALIANPEHLVGFFSEDARSSALRSMLHSKICRLEKAKASLSKST